MPARKGPKKVNRYSLELKRTAVRLCPRKSVKSSNNSTMTGGTSSPCAEAIASSGTRPSRGESPFMASPATASLRVH